MDADAFRHEFPVLEHVAYLNAGTDGPVPRRAYEAASVRMREELDLGRAGKQYFERLLALGESLREHLATWLGCDAADVALTHSTTDGVATALSALELGPGDEVLTSDEEHPGLLAPLEGARRRSGFSVRVAPFARLADALDERTRLVACSHVSWVNGQVADTAALASDGRLLLLDGAQGIGAVPLDMGRLGCDFYAASGQKWLCGPDGSGCLYVKREVAKQLDPPWPNYRSLADASRPSDLIVHDGAHRFDLGVAPGPATAWALAALELLEQFGLDALHDRAAGRAERLAEMLGARGREVAPRGRSTLVSWHSGDPEEEVARLAAAGVAVRHLPGRGLVRASVGAWTSDDDLERLVGAL